MSVEADDLVSFGHDNVQIVRNHQNPAVKIISDCSDELVKLIFSRVINALYRFIENEQVWFTSDRAGN